MDNHREDNMDDCLDRSCRQKMQIIRMLNHGKTSVGDLQLCVTWLGVFCRAAKKETQNRDRLLELMLRQLRDTGRLSLPFTDLSNCKRELSQLLIYAEDCPPPTCKPQQPSTSVGKQVGKQAPVQYRHEWRKQLDQLDEMEELYMRSEAIDSPSTGHSEKCRKIGIKEKHKMAPRVKAGMSLPKGGGKSLASGLGIAPSSRPSPRQKRDLDHRQRKLLEINNRRERDRIQREIHAKHREQERARLVDQIRRDREDLINNRQLWQQENKRLHVKVKAQSDHERNLIQKKRLEQRQQEERARNRCQRDHIEQMHRERREMERRDRIKRSREIAKYKESVTIMEPKKGEYKYLEHCETEENERRICLSALCSSCRENVAQVSNKCRVSWQTEEQKDNVRKKAFWNDNRRDLHQEWVKIPREEKPKESNSLNKNELPRQIDGPENNYQNPREQEASPVYHPENIEDIHELQKKEMMHLISILWQERENQLKVMASVDSVHKLQTGKRDDLENRIKPQEDLQITRLKGQHQKVKDDEAFETKLLETLKRKKREIVKIEKRVAERRDKIRAKTVTGEERPREARETLDGKSQTRPHNADEIKVHKVKRKGEADQIRQEQTASFPMSFFIALGRILEDIVRKENGTGDEKRTHQNKENNDDKEIFREQLEKVRQYIDETKIEQKGKNDGKATKKKEEGIIKKDHTRKAKVEEKLVSLEVIDEKAKEPDNRENTSWKEREKNHYEQQGIVIDQESFKEAAQEVGQGKVDEPQEMECQDFVELKKIADEKVDGAREQRDELVRKALEPTENKITEFPELKDYRKKTDKEIPSNELHIIERPDVMEANRKKDYLEKYDLTENEEGETCKANGSPREANRKREHESNENRITDKDECGRNEAEKFDRMHRKNPSQIEVVEYKAYENLKEQAKNELLQGQTKLEEYQSRQKMMEEHLQKLKDQSLRGKQEMEAIFNQYVELTRTQLKERSGWDCKQEKRLQDSERERKPKQEREVELQLEKGENVRNNDRKREKENEHKTEKEQQQKLWNFSRKTLRKRSEGNERLHRRSSRVLGEVQTNSNDQEITEKEKQDIPKQDEFDENKFMGYHKSQLAEVTRQKSPSTGTKDRPRAAETQIMSHQRKHIIQHGSGSFLAKGMHQRHRESENTDPDLDLGIEFVEAAEALKTLKSNADTLACRLQEHRLRDGFDAGDKQPSAKKQETISHRPAQHNPVSDINWQRTQVNWEHADKERELYVQSLERQEDRLQINSAPKDQRPKYFMGSNKRAHERPAAMQRANPGFSTANDDCNKQPLFSFCGEVNSSERKYMVNYHADDKTLMREYTNPSRIRSMFPQMMDDVSIPEDRMTRQNGGQDIQVNNCSIRVQPYQERESCAYRNCCTVDHTNTLETEKRLLDWPTKAANFRSNYVHNALNQSARRVIAILRGLNSCSTSSETGEESARVPDNIFRTLAEPFLEGNQELVQKFVAIVTKLDEELKTHLTGRRVSEDQTRQAKQASLAADPQPIATQTLSQWWKLNRSTMHFLKDLFCKHCDVREALVQETMDTIDCYYGEWSMQHFLYKKT